MAKFRSSEFILLIALLFISLMHQDVLCKECTNAYSQVSSHTFRYAVLSSADANTFLNSTRREVQIASAPHIAEVIGLSYPIPQDVPHAVQKASKSNESILQEVSLHDVRLSSTSLQGIATQTNLEYLLMLDVDSLVWSFRNTANLSTPGSPYGGWESPTSELRGHFVGHYMSAMAKMWASTHNKTVHEKMTAVVDALLECQQNIGTGYLSAFPSTFFDRFEQLLSVWAPYYTIHKIMAGLLDQYTFAGNARAFTMAVSMADYFNQRVLKVIEMYTIERHWLSLNEETGGMNDVLYQLYTLTDNRDHLRLAHLFDKPCFLGPLAVEADDISGFHANTHIPVVIGAQMRYEVTGDNIYKKIGSFFMDTVNSSHSYPTGGTSYGEFWADPLRIGDALSSTETEESCTTYNMLKVARHLFCWTKKMKYADYYERALTNGVLSIQRGQEPGIMVYMLPMGKGMSKAISYHGWGTKFDSFWCCYGTGIESFSKLGDSIYFEEKGASPALYIIQLVSSSLIWRTAEIVLQQTVNNFSSNNPYTNISFEFYSINKDEKISKVTNLKNATIKLRIPFWARSCCSSVLLNNKSLQVPLPGEFLTVTHTWQDGDKLEIVFEARMRAEQVKDDRKGYTSLHALFFGPYLLAGMSNGDWDITGVDMGQLCDWVTPVPSSSGKNIYSFSQEMVLSNSSMFITHTGNSLSMIPHPLKGTNVAASSTFRMADPVTEHLVTGSCLKGLLMRAVKISEKTKISERYDNESRINVLGKLVAIEPFDQPGTFFVHASDENINIVGANILKNRAEGCGHDWEQPSGINAVFQVIPGLSAQDNTVSFEAASKPGCFLSSESNSLRKIRLKCTSSDNDENFTNAVSFIANKALASYHSISFVAKGANRQYLLFPLVSYEDENYTVFFNITS